MAAGSEAADFLPGSLPSDLPIEKRVKAFKLLSDLNIRIEPTAKWLAREFDSTIVQQYRSPVETAVLNRAVNWKGLGLKLGIDAGTISRWMRKRKPQVPDWSRLFLGAAAYGIDFSGIVPPLPPGQMTVINALCTIVPRFRKKYLKVELEPLTYENIAFLHHTTHSSDWREAMNTPNIRNRREAIKDISARIEALHLDIRIDNI